MPVARKKTDRAYITPREWAEDFGGHKARADLPAGAGVLPYDQCGLTFRAFEPAGPGTVFAGAVAGPTGVLYDVRALAAYMRTHGGADPATGARLRRTDLVPARLHVDAVGRFHCPALYREFTPATKIALVRPSGNVYCWDALEQLNLRAHNMVDLLTGQPFARSDILVLQDPAHPENRRISSFFHVQQAQSGASSSGSGGGGGSKSSGGGSASDSSNHSGATDKNTVNLSLTAEKTLKQLAERLPAATATSETDSKQQQQQQRKEKEPIPQRLDAAAPGLTSTAFSAAVLRERDLAHDLQAVKRTRHRGYVTLETSCGPLRVEVRCDVAGAARAAEHFLAMCARGVYRGCALAMPPVDWPDWRAAFARLPLLVSREVPVSAALDPAVPMPPFDVATPEPAEAVLEQLQTVDHSAKGGAAKATGTTEGEQEEEEEETCIGVLAIVNTGVDARARAQGLAAGDGYAAAAAAANGAHTTQLAIACGRLAATQLCTEEIAAARDTAAAARAHHRHVALGRVVGGRASLQRALDAAARGTAVRITRAIVHVDPFTPARLAREHAEDARAARREAEAAARREAAGSVRGAWFSDPAAAAQHAGAGLLAPDPHTDADSESTISFSYEDAYTVRAPAAKKNRGFDDW